MLTLPAELLPLIAAFARLFSTSVWEHAIVLLVSAMLATGKRTVMACCGCHYSTAVCYAA